MSALEFFIWRKRKKLFFFIGITIHFTINKIVDSADVAMALYDDGQVPLRMR